jgi:hypothetical protein
MAKILYEAKRRRRNSGAWGVARNTLIRFRLPYARTAAGLSPFDDPASGRCLWMGAIGTKPGQFAESGTSPGDRRRGHALLPGDVAGVAAATVRPTQEFGRRR